jgi:hypothetical protein
VKHHPLIYSYLEGAWFLCECGSRGIGYSVREVSVLWAIHLREVLFDDLDDTVRYYSVRR